MGQEIDLLALYPRPKRETKERGQSKTQEDRAIARRFGKEFFDGERRHGYGGFRYLDHLWPPVIETIRAHYPLPTRGSLLDVGAAKGFLLYDFQKVCPFMTFAGVDISEYAILHAMAEVKPFLQIANATSLPFPDHSFDLVLSINTLHNLDLPDLTLALQEIERVSRQFSFITVDAYRTAEEKERIFDWNLTAKTILHTEEWKALFHQAGYTGDYYWFFP